MKKRKILSLILALAALAALAVSPALAASTSADAAETAEASEASGTSEAGSSSTILESMEVQAEAALLMDADTGNILFEQNGSEKVYPASTTKMMVAVCVMRAIDEGTLTMDTKITAQDDCWEGLTSDSSNANIQPGEVMTVRELMDCLMIPSANEAANILGEEISGSISAFVQLMNETAAELGCTNTHFVNTHGMHDDDHYTTCEDLAIIAQEVLKYDDLREIVATEEVYIDATNLSEQRHYFNTNGLLSNLRYRGYVYSKCIGIKTGSTDEAGYCLVSAAEDNGQTLIAVVMGCENPTDEDGNIQRLQFSESSRLLEWGFENFHIIDLIDETKVYGTVEVTMSDVDSVSLVADGTISAQLPIDITTDMVTQKIQLVSSVQAPVKKGDILGSMTLLLDGKEYGTVNLVAVNDVEVNELLLRKSQIESWVGSLWGKLVIILVVVLVVALLVRLIFFRKKKNRYGSGGGSRRTGGGYRRGRRR